MTQEELDALMNGDTDIDSLEDEVEETQATTSNDAANTIEDDAEDGYRPSSINNMPPPPTDDNKMVHQLDDVTKESEEKATEIFDIIEGISNDMMDSEEAFSSVMDTVKENIDIFEKLHTKFPDIASFNDLLEKNKQSLEKLENLVQTTQDNGDAIMNVMDIMQYQDIHRQKIERVINVMRALSAYMNTLFSGKIDDEKRVSSAVHLPGDDSTDNVVNEDDIEALLASFGKK